MEKNYKILFVDDDKRYAEPIVIRAYNEHNLHLHLCEDWEEGKSLILNDPQMFQAIIIDGRGKLKQGEKGDNPKHLQVALNDIKEIHEKVVYIPYVINTAYYQEFSTYFDEKKMVDKKDTDILFSMLKKLISSSNEDKIKSKYSDVFDCFGEKYLPFESSELLMEVLLDVENNVWTASSFNSLRKVIEAIYLKLHDINDELIPNCCINFDRGTVNFDSCAKRLSRGQELRERSGTVIVKAITPVVPEHLGWLVQPLDKICSICSHTYKDSKYVNIYSLKAIVFGVMELLIWFKKYVDENYE